MLTVLMRGDSVFNSITANGGGNGVRPNTTGAVLLGTPLYGGAGGGGGVHVGGAGGAYGNR